MTDNGTNTESRGNRDPGTGSNLNSRGRSPRIRSCNDGPALKGSSWSGFFVEPLQDSEEFGGAAIPGLRHA